MIRLGYRRSFVNNNKLIEGRKEDEAIVKALQI
jgi:hypothetical protein